MVDSSRVESEGQMLCQTGNKFNLQWIALGPLPHQLNEKKG